MIRLLIAVYMATAVAVAAAPPAPLAKIPTGQTNTYFSAKWNRSTGATGYYLDVATDAGFTAFVASFNNRDVANLDTFRVTGLTTNTRYYYRVRAYDGTGTSGNSNVRTAYTRPTTTWNGAAWSNGRPSGTRRGVIDSVYTVGQEAVSIRASRLFVNPGATILVDTARYLRIDSSALVEGSLVVLSKGTKCGTLTGNASWTVSGGTVQIQRQLSAGRWHLVAAPVPSATTALFTGAYLRSYNESANTFGGYITSTTTPLTPGVGFAMWTNTDRLITYSGVPNTGNVSPPITYDGISTHGYNLVGNPYAAPLDWQASGWTRTSMSNTMWQWVHSAGNYGTRTTGGASTNGVGRYVPVGQGFFVKANAATAALTIPASARNLSTGAMGQAVYKSLDDTLDDTITPPDIPQVDVLFMAVTGDSSYRDEIALHFDTAAGEGYNPDWDAHNLLGDSAAPQLYSVLGSEWYTAKGLPWPTAPLHILVHCTPGTASSNYTFTARGDLTARLTDLKLDRTVDIVDGAQYAFSAETTDAPARFELTFDAAAVRPGHRPATTPSLELAQRGRALLLRAGQGVREISVLDMRGRVVYHIAGAEPGSRLLPLPAGSYVVRAHTLTGVKCQSLVMR